MEQFDIRYIKLTFELAFEEKTELPEYKVSALRGGIGEMLLQTHCIGNRACDSCSFAEECVVQRIYYHKMKIVPDYVGNKESIGYLYECDNRQTTFEAGEKLVFHMVLFGDVVVHFANILQAVFQLGRVGLGKHKAMFSVENVWNHRGEAILENGYVVMNRVCPDSMESYVRERDKPESSLVKLRFFTPLTLKYRGEFLQQFDANAMMEAIYRRLYLLHCMEGIEMERQCPLIDTCEMVEQKAKKAVVTRYSSTQDQKIALHGIQGELVLRIKEPSVWRYLAAGQLTHIGKNTTMGFGQYGIDLI